MATTYDQFKRHLKKLSLTELYTVLRIASHNRMLALTDASYVTPSQEKLELAIDAIKAEIAKRHEGEK